ncbi:MAG TPA: glycosyltransferase family 2 protein [Pilimelia sp.]|nr:glycosyltransferase family 2 protein [Pilimelia sp.]
MVTHLGRRRPLLSIVVPVYGVEAYLRQCLDSLLTEAGPDVEVVAVDDASPDGCPAVLDRYAAANPLLRVLHLPANVGLGEARNAGLARAAGEYVWFVDSDDWLPGGTVPAVLAALRSLDPDVLLLDHDRVYADGRVETDASSPVLRGVPGTVNLARRPELLGLQHAAWNRVVRRRLLDDIGLRFFPGWYEDVPFSHPLLLAAGSIGVLDRVCYHYRQRPTGAITRTVSERHFEAFDQYERLWATVDGLGDRAAPFRADLFRMMINHLLVVAGNESRVPPARRRAFFRELAAVYRRYLPAGGYRAPGGTAGLKHRVVGAGAYPAYAALRAAYRAARRVGRTTAPAEPAGRATGAAVRGGTSSGFPAAPA